VKSNVLAFNSVRPELVEGLRFLPEMTKKEQGFDKLSPNGA
jgi:hypothetical protein